MREIGLLSGSAMGERRDDAEHLPRHLALDQTVMAALAVNGPDPSLASYSAAHVSLPLLPNAHGLRLRREATITHMNCFLDHIGILFPCFCASALMEQYESVIVKHSTSPTLGECSSVEFDVMMAIAIGTLMSSASSRLESFTLQLHAAALKYLPSMLQSADGLNAISSMIFLAIFSFYSPIGGSAWHLIGFAMERARSLRLHKEPSHHTGTPQPILERRRGLFWSLYLLDRYALCLLLHHDLKKGPSLTLADH